MESIFPLSTEMHASGPFCIYQSSAGKNHASSFVDQTYRSSYKLTVDLSKFTSEASSKEKSYTLHLSESMRTVVDCANLIGNISIAPTWHNASNVLCYEVKFEIENKIRALHGGPDLTPTVVSATREIRIGPRSQTGTEPKLLNVSGRETLKDLPVSGRSSQRATFEASSKQTVFLKFDLAIDRRLTSFEWDSLTSAKVRGLGSMLNGAKQSGDVTICAKVFRSLFALPSCISTKGNPDTTGMRTSDTSKTFKAPVVLLALRFRFCI